MSTSHRPASLIILSVLAGIAISVFITILLSELELLEFEDEINIGIIVISLIVAIVVVRRVGRYRSIRVTLSITHTVAYTIITIILQQWIVTELKEYLGIFPS